MPLEELVESVEQTRRDTQLRYVVIYGAACSYCLARAERLDESYLRTFALELKEQLAQTLAALSYRFWLSLVALLVLPKRGKCERIFKP
jgi:hypothetical protein